MNKCYHCGHENRVGEYFCHHCGKPITSPTTREISGDHREFIDPSMIGSHYVDSDSLIHLHVQDAANPIIFCPSEQTILGRLVSGRVEHPDIDLTLYSALDKGVSCIHAAIERIENSLNLIDLSSRNGTYLNGQNLPPDERHKLCDGDELRFGDLVVHIYFR